MSGFNLKPKQASMVWLEPHRLQVGGKLRPLQGAPAEAVLAEALAATAPGPTHWVVDDAWVPSLLMRDIVEIPAGAEAREAFFRWRFSQSLATDAPQYVQALGLGDHAWLLAGMAQELRETWLAAAGAAGHSIRSLVPRWLWLYNRLAPSRQTPGLLLSLCPVGRDERGEELYSGTLAAWGRELILLRQWTDPATPDSWNQERVLPTVAYLQRDARTPQDLHLWGALRWPQGPVPVQILPPQIPEQESC